MASTQTTNPAPRAPRALGALPPFLRPYRNRIALPFVFLCLAAGATLAFPLALRGLIDHASGHEHQITMIWQAIEKLAKCAQSELGRDCMPQDAQTTEHFDAEGLNKLVK